jgi:uncharacterized protein YggU (UPF0235/DUF167 family)
MPRRQRFTAKITTSAGKDEVRGWEQGPGNSIIMKINVTDAPDKGKANKAVISLLAAYWGIPKSAISIVRGHTNRVKILEIQGVDIDITHIPGTGKN